ncbi:RHS repeat-associated core domain-containing protein [Actinoplanes couchii]|uniref:Teneurin-like YD-shell domain-containing protein n=2 Tax=Actinoplanes couchii TaxID=403638 RepID=A0ABQ3XRU6_9ACTN|nr:RHS repeat-associated core domain-containing protein [Actinoplanes couchii]GID61190.1 hypothetical protein Aco03nite_095940 [Actinoplanes couchii]
MLVGNDVANLINLFRGEVTMPLDLVSLPGRNGLNVAITALYGSGVHQAATSWNRSEPTGILGTGWSMPLEQIIVDRQSAGTNLDDTFYLVSGGVPRLLTRVGLAGTAQLFQSQEHNFWQIRYVPDAVRPQAEYWEVTRTDGTVWVYGSGAVQWGVRWGNWIGPSTADNGTRYPVAWNLHEVRAITGDRLSLEFDYDEVPIGDGTTAYTRACRLRRIVAPDATTIDLRYLPKEPAEAPPPEIPPPGGRQAYQYHLDPFHLDRVEVNDPAGNLISTTRLGYELRNVSPQRHNTDYLKRFLTSVRQETADGAALPDLRLDYHDADQASPGALATVTSPQGGRLHFTYACTPLPNSILHQSIPSPGTGWTPRIWHGHRYAVVTWVNTATGAVTVTVCSWNGSWSSQQDTRDWRAVPNSLRVSTGDDFFAVWYQDSHTQQYRVQLLRADPYRFGTWQRTPHEVILSRPMIAPAVSTGAGFVSVADAAAGQLAVVSWDPIGNQWTTAGFGLPAGTGHTALAAGLNFCVLCTAPASGTGLTTTLYYSGPDRRWLRGGSVTDTVSVDWTLTRADRMLAAGNSFAAVGFVTGVDELAATVAYATRLLPWSTNYQFGTILKAEGSQPLATRNPVGYVTVNGSTVANGQHLFRFEGSTWRQVSTVAPVLGPRYVYAYDTDAAYTVTVQDSGAWTADLRQYNPYTGSWSTPTRISGSGSAVPVIGGGYRTDGRSLLRREPDGSWVTVYTLPADADLTTLINHAPSYLVYQNTAGSTRVLTLADGGVRTSVTLPGEHVIVADPRPGQHLTGPTALVTFRGSDFDNATSLTLYRLVDGQITNRLVARQLVSVANDTGYGVTPTTVDYDTATATYDPYGLVTQYVRVRVTVGDGSDGAVERVFFNGLSPSVPGVVYPVSDAYTNARTFFSALHGQLYRTRGFTADGRLMSESHRYPYVSTGDTDLRICGTYTRIRRQTEAAAAELFPVTLDYTAALDARTVPDGLKDRFSAAGLSLAAPVTVVVEQTGRRWAVLDASGARYQVATDEQELQVYGWLTSSAEFGYNTRGQVSRRVSHGIDGSGVTRKRHVDTTYGWEVYPDLLALNCLDPVAQVTAIDDTAGLVTDSRVTTYTDVWGPWVADSEYVWQGGNPRADFHAWGHEDEPGDGWLRTRAVLAIGDHAQPLSAADEGGHVATVIFDRAGQLQVANTINADPGAGEASSYGFEAYESTGGWTLTPAGLDPDRYLLAGDAHTGSRALVIPSDPDLTVGITNRLSPARGNLVYLLSCWVKTTAGFVVDPDRSAWRITVEGEQGTAVPIVLPIPDTAGCWQWLCQSVDPDALGVGTIRSVNLALTNRQDHADLLVDNLGFAPVSGALQATVYSPDGWQLWATVDLFGQTNRLAYDRWQRAVIEVGPDDSPRSMVATQLWRQTSDGEFDPATPSSTVHVVLRGGGTFTDFRRGEQWRDGWDATGTWQRGPGRLSFSGGGRATLTSRPLLDGGDPFDAVVYRFALADPAPTMPLHLSFGGGWSVDWAAGTWSLLAPDGEPVGTCESAPGSDLMLLLWQHRLLLLVDGRVTLQHVVAPAKTGAGFTGAVTLGTEGPLALSWLAVGSAPAAGLTWLDNVGRARQLQRLDDTVTRVSATLHDQAGRAYADTRTARFDQSPVGYRASLVTELNPATGALNDCEMTRQYPDDKGYPFARTRFEPAPGGRAIETGLPGEEFAINPAVPAAQRHTTRRRFQLNTAEPLMARLPAGRYPVTATLDPDGRLIRTWQDQFGQVVAEAAGDLTGTSGVASLERTYYDVFGNPVRREQPNMFDPGVADREHFVTTTTYDAAGNPTSVTSPDVDGPVQSVFDRLGRLRFSSSPVAASADYLCYLCYDDLGRIVEEGTCHTPWNLDLLRRHADDPAWLPAVGKWLHRYRYDGDGTDLNLHGRLWQARSRSESAARKGSDTGVVTTLGYTSTGLVATRSTSVDGYDGGQPHTIGYRYDGLGAITAIRYEAQREPAAFTARYRANGFNEIVEVIGVAADRPGVLARFDYTPDGSLSSEVIAPGTSGELPRSYRYTSTGWMAEVSDRYLTETTQYTSDGLTGVGYYSGIVARVASVFSDVDGPGFVTDHDYRYGYDPLGRLTTAVGSASERHSFLDLGYDANGNVRHRDDQLFTYTEGTNRLRAIGTGGPDGYAYNADGDLAEAPALSLTGVTYDPVSTLVTDMDTATGTVHLDYAADNGLVCRSYPDGRRLYIPGADGEPLVLGHTGNDGGSALSCLIPGPNGPVAVWSPTGTAYVLRGRLGTTRAIYDGTAVVGAFNYLPYGGFLGAPIETGATGTFPYLFAGAERETVTGLYMFPLRLYDPVSGRFLSTDPAGQFSSPYLYAGGDPVNGCDPTGGFAFSWQSFLAATAGVALVIGGAALTIFTAGAATPLVTAGGLLLGGALIGAGFGSAAYGVTHVDAEKQPFDAVEWGISVGLGAAFGTASAGLGFAMAPLSSAAAFVGETAIGAGFGALDSVMTNGAINSYYGRNFGAGAATAAWQGALGGAVGGAIGGTLGRGPIARTNRVVRAGRTGPGGQVGHVVQDTFHSVWHSVAAARQQPGAWSFTHLVFAGSGYKGKSSVFLGGMGTSASRRSLTEIMNYAGTRRTAMIEVPGLNAQRAVAYGNAALAQGSLGPFNFLTNGCTSYARGVLRAAGLEPPVWALTATGIDFWLRTLGARAIR